MRGAGAFRVGHSKPIGSRRLGVGIRGVVGVVGGWAWCSRIAFRVFLVISSGFY
jgi:hypothetical protein